MYEQEERMDSMVAAIIQSVRYVMRYVEAMLELLETGLRTPFKTECTSYHIISHHIISHHITELIEIKCN